MTGLQQSAAEPKLTYREFVRFPDDGRRHELIDGKHYVTPAPTLWHQRLSMRLTMALGKYLESHPIGELFAAPCAVVLSLFDIVLPDLLLVLNDQAAILTKRTVRGAPALVIEINSEST